MDELSVENAQLSLVKPGPTGISPPTENKQHNGICLIGLTNNRWNLHSPYNAWIPPPWRFI